MQAVWTRNIENDAVAPPLPVVKTEIYFEKASIYAGEYLLTGNTKGRDVKAQIIDHLGG
jgi:hypothetical protein